MKMLSIERAIKRVSKVGVERIKLSKKKSHPTGIYDVMTGRMLPKKTKKYYKEYVKKSKPIKKGLAEQFEADEFEDEFYDKTDMEDYKEELSGKKPNEYFKQAYPKWSKKNYKQLKKSIWKYFEVDKIKGRVIPAIYTLDKLTEVKE